MSTISFRTPKVTDRCDKILYLCGFLLYRRSATKAIITNIFISRQAREALFLIHERIAFKCNCKHRLVFYLLKSFRVVFYLYDNHISLWNVHSEVLIIEMYLVARIFCVVKVPDNTFIARK